MKKIRKIALILFLFVFYIYVLAIQSLPSSIILFEGEKLNIKTIFGISIKNIDESYDVLPASSAIEGQSFSKTGNTTLAVNLFGEFTVKTIDVDVLENKYVVPLGNIAGVKLYTNGVLVVGMSEVQTSSGSVKPYENSGIEEGDRIIEINGESVEDTNDLKKKVNSIGEEEIEIKYVCNGEENQTKIVPAKMSNGEYKLGLWVRDSAAGIGTLTFYDPETNIFGALGHGLTDIDTENLLEISSGEFVTAKILSIIKGQSNNPGKIQGSIDNQDTIGMISENTKFGIYGTVLDLSQIGVDTSKTYQVASRSEIKTGKATILSDVDGEGIKEYEIEIDKIFINNNEDNKSMLIKVTDEELLEKTGGIIQGMSGSPIIQNGKLIGSVTHVLVSTPTTGYAIFADLMLKEALN